VGGTDFGHAFGWYLILWGIMSLGLCAPVAFVSKVVLVQQFVLSVVFFLLAASFYGSSTGLGKAGGYFGLIDALFCFYICISLTTNETAGKTVLPLP
jgi:succinate-acetate transporter protein